MINQSPWGIGNKTARNMTQRNVNGQWILSGRRAKGTFTPSPETLGAQEVAAYVWAVFRGARDYVRRGWTSKLQKQPAASAWYKWMYEHAMGATPVTTPTPTVVDFRFAKGTMLATDVTEIADASDESISFTWSTVLGDASQLLTDRFSWVVINVENPLNPDGTYRILSGTSAAPRSVGSLSVTTPTGWMTAGDQLYVWTSFSGAGATANAGTSSSDDFKAVTVQA